MHDLTYQPVIEQQQMLIKHIFDEQSNKGAYDQRGIEIYRRNLRATASQALAITYPTVFKLIGRELFQFASNLLLQLTPPSAGDWGLWGEGFDDVLASLQQLEDYPYVVDCARLDLVRHKIERVKNPVFNSESLELLTKLDLNDIRIAFTDTTVFLITQYPVIEAWHSNHSDEPSRFIESFNQRLSQGESEQRVLVFRPHFRAEMTELDMHQSKWMELLLSGITIGHALDQMDGSTFSFDEWLVNAMQNKMISTLESV